MSPVVQFQASEKRRPARRRWLLALAFLPLLLLSLLMVPLVRPVKIRVGPMMLFLGLTPVPAKFSQELPQGFSGRDSVKSPGGIGTDPEGRTYVIRGPDHTRVIRVGDWTAYAWWFQGQPGR